MLNRFSFAYSRWIALVLSCGLLAPLGCRHRAYTDVYVDNMAAEIRDLEDQLYTYDYEYRVLQQQLDAEKAKNSQLQQNTAAPPHTIFPKKSAPENSRLEFSPPTHIESSPQSIQEIPMTSPSSSAPSSELQLPSILVPEVIPAPSETQALPPKTPKAQPENLQVPLIEPGVPQPPKIPVPTTNNSTSNDLELNISRIEVPAQLASNAKTVGPAKLKIGTELPKNTRITEIAFNTLLSRTANFDGQSDDDGLYLVLVPKNEQGEMVPTAGEVDIAVLDPAREGQEAWISRWHYSAEEVKAKLQPIGTSQGIHLTLPWNGPDPIADRVMVNVKYTLSDGRQVVCEPKTFFVSGPTHGKTVWVPRSADRQVTHASHIENSGAGNVVRPAAAIEQPAPRPN